MMKDKKTLMYIIIIIIMILILGVLWYLLLTDKGSNNNTPTQMNNSSTSYSASKEITTDEDISEGKYESTKADENVILATGNIKSTLSNLTINKTGDSSGEDNTSFSNLEKLWCRLFIR